MPNIAYAATFLFTFSALLIVGSTLDLVNSNKVAVSDLQASQQSDSERLKELKRLIDNEIGVPYANEPSQCRLVGFGSKPCGGPWTYLVYSTVQTNKFELKKLVIEYNQVQRRVNIERKIWSDCALARKPKKRV